MSQALEAGQFDAPAELGRTPQNNSAGIVNDAGPTPDSRAAADQDKDTQGQEAQPPANQDQAATPENEGAPAGSGEQSEELEGSEEEGGEREEEWYYEGKHSRYQSEDEYKQAIDLKDELVHQYRSQLSELEEKYTEAKSVLDEQNRILPEDQRKQVLIRAYQLEELGDKRDEILAMSEEDVDSNPEVQDKLKRAEIRAEIRYENEVKKAQDDRQRQLTERKSRLAEAEKFVREHVTEKRFGANSVEDRIRLGRFFQEETGTQGLNRAEALMMLYDEHGKELAEWALAGAVNQFGSRRQKKVEETVDKAKPAPRTPTPPAPTPKPKKFDTPLDTLLASFENS